MKDLIKACLLLPPIGKDQYLRLHLNHEDTQNPLARVPEARLLALWHLLAEFSPSDDFGLILGQTIDPQSKGLLASWVSQSDNLGEALNVFQQNIALMNASERWEIEHDQKICSLTLYIDENRGYPYQAIERSMAALVSWARALSSDYLSIQSASFTFKQPAYLDKYIAIFGENLSFNDTQNRLSFSSKLLEHPITTGNRYLKSVMAKSASEALDSIKHPQKIKNQVAEIIGEHLTEGHIIRVDDLSAQLHMSRQTLYRRLEQEKTSFVAIVDQIRKKRAATLIRAGKLTILEISYSLGFSDSSSFHKAFKRWFGVTPREYPPPPE
ncbi:AraC family transcriptional regulator ligand-binding domain-containing protein [Agarivorans sp. MS3-6]